MSTNETHKSCAAGCGARLGGKRDLYLADDAIPEAGIDESGDLYCREDYLERFGTDPLVDAAVEAAGADG